jgi:hypothetical protein
MFSRHYSILPSLKIFETLTQSMSFQLVESTTTVFYCNTVNNTHHTAPNVITININPSTKQTLLTIPQLIEQLWYNVESQIRCENELCTNINCRNRDFPRISQTKLKKFSNILRIEFIRHSYDNNNEVTLICDQEFIFPPSCLTNHCFQLQENHSLSYKLKGLVIRIGGNRNGHYQIYIQNDETLKWHLFDADNVIEINTTSDDIFSRGDIYSAFYQLSPTIKYITASSIDTNDKR